MLTGMAAVGSLFHTATGTAFADLTIDRHRETWPIRSKRFRTWLRRRYYQETGSALSASIISSALDLLEAQAQFDGPERSVHVRVAEHAGHIYLDLADEDSRAGRNRTRGLARDRIAAGALPPAGRHAAAARAAAGRIDPGTRSTSQRRQPK